MVGCNPLRSLPPDLAFLTSLTSLSCDDCLLEYKSLPSPVVMLSNLVELRLSGNKLSGLASTDLSGFSSLKILNVDNNLISSLPERLPLPALEVFSARSNDIKTPMSEGAFEGCPELRVLR